MTTTICHICEVAIEGPNQANCHACQRDFHLQIRMDLPATDCGAVWLHDERMHLVFGCTACIDAGEFGEESPREDA